VVIGPILRPVAAVDTPVRRCCAALVAQTFVDVRAPVVQRLLRAGREGRHRWLRRGTPPRCRCRDRLIVGHLNSSQFGGQPPSGCSSWWGHLRRSGIEVREAGAERTLHSEKSPGLKAAAGVPTSSLIGGGGGIRTKWLGCWKCFGESARRGAALAVKFLPSLVAPTTPSPLCQIMQAHCYVLASSHVHYIEW